MSDNTDTIVASDVVPPVRKINSLQALTRLKPKRGSEWCTFAFVLNRDMIKPDGSLDELHAVVFPLGAFDEQEKAEKHAKSIIEITGHPGVIAACYGSPIPLTTNFDPSVVEDVPVNMKGRLIKLESDQYKRDREQYEERAKIERELVKEAEEETDPDHIEHFKRQCYLAIKAKAKYQHHLDEYKSALDAYKKRESLVRDHYNRHPEHEKEWLPYLKEKLIERGESDLYQMLETGYNELRNELLDITDTTCDDGVCVVSQDTTCDDGVCDNGVCIVSQDDDIQVVDSQVKCGKKKRGKQNNRK